MHINPFDNVVESRSIDRMVWVYCSVLTRMLSTDRLINLVHHNLHFENPIVLVLQDPMLTGINICRKHLPHVDEVCNCQII
jgi:hypothetical protein